MAVKKEVSIETAKAAPAAKEVKKVEVKTTAKAEPAPAAEAEAAPAKAAKSTTTAKKTTAKKTTTSKKTTTTKKTAAKKAEESKKAATVPTAVKNAGVFVQFNNKENELNALKERIVEHWCATENKKPSAIKEMSIYIKPEDNAAYYVINGQGSSIEL